MFLRPLVIVLCTLFSVGMSAVAEPVASLNKGESNKHLSPHQVLIQFCTS